MLTIPQSDTAEWASTGPRSFERGNATFPVVGVPQTDASTGPRSFERGNLANSSWVCLEVIASTGPRSFERGNPDDGRNSTSEKSASTGPRSFERGNQGVPRGPRPGRLASTGPRSFERGNAVADLKHKFSAFRLQRGRAHSSAEIDSQQWVAARPCAASTGPRSFERGNIAGHRCGRIGRSSFNGAALIRARKLRRVSIVLPTNPRFNGAALR